VNNCLSSSGQKFVREYLLTAPELPADVQECDAIRAVHTPEQNEFIEKILNGSQAKTAYAIRFNSERMISESDLASTVFLTLTVGDTDRDGRFKKVFDSDEANRRFNNLNRRVLPDIFERAIVVTERHKDRGVHFHVLGVLKGRPDIRTGFDFGQVDRRDYRSVSRRLRAVWELLRGVLPEYGFGRAETLPIRKSGPAVAAYVSKYIEKNVCNRLKADKGKRLVRYLGWQGSQLKPNGFGWASVRSTAWRMKTKQLFHLVGIEAPEEASTAIGVRWAWHSTQIWGRGIGLADTFPGLCCSWLEKRRLKSEIIRLNERYFIRLEETKSPKTGFIEDLEDECPDYFDGIWENTTQTDKCNPLTVNILEYN
jgi:hypothetical protein